MEQQVYTVILSQTPEAVALITANSRKEALQIAGDMAENHREQLLTIPMASQIDIYDGRAEFFKAFRQAKAILNEDPLDENNCPF